MNESPNTEDHPKNESTTIDGRTDAEKRRFEAFTLPPSWGSTGLSPEDAEERIATLERQFED